MNDPSTIRQALTRELLRAQTVTRTRTLQDIPRQGASPAVATSLAGADDVTGIFMAEVTGVDGGTRYE